jgi:DNA-directed RNA polymerase subunit RPC12/RpoP
MKESRATAVYGTYRCPVCGHREGTEMAAQETSRRVNCTYCHTALEVTSRGPSSARFSVQVAPEPAAI